MKWTKVGLRRQWPLHPIFMRRTHIMSFEKYILFHVKPKKIYKVLGNFLKCIWKAPYIHDSMCHLCMFNFMIAFVSSLTISKAQGCGTFSKLELGLNYCLVLGPLSWECPILRLYPTHRQMAGVLVSSIKPKASYTLHNNIIHEPKKEIEWGNVLPMSLAYSCTTIIKYIMKYQTTNMKLGHHQFPY